jgi:aryl-alcohol dehydrogenase-like predicted oxidoreductase
MLERALRDDLWDVIMVGFNVLNQSARDRVLARTRASGVGVLDMFAVRLALSRPERLLDVINGLVSDGAITIDQLRDAGGTMEDPLGWVVRDSDADTLVEAAYRFVRHEPGIDVTLTGTGTLEHLLANITAIQMPPLPDDVVARLKRLFSAVDSVSGQ